MTALPAPTLTIGIPAFNEEKALERSIASVQQQSWAGDLEILVVDDGSTDGTVALVEQLREKDPRIRLVRHERNCGRPFARNTILQEARGKFLTWLDADDEWYPHKLSSQFEALYEAMAQLDTTKIICMCPFHWQWAHAGRMRSVVPDVEGDHLRKFLDGKLGAYLWSMLGLTETFRSVGLFDEKLPRLQDLDFLIRYAKSGGALVTTKTQEPQCIYYKTDQNRSGRVVAQSLMHIWGKHRPLYQQYGRGFARWCRNRHFALASRHSYDLDPANAHARAFNQALNATLPRLEAQLAKLSP